MKMLIVSPVDEKTKQVGSPMLITKKTTADKSGETIYSIVSVIGWFIVWFTFALVAAIFIWIY